jgi:hypothetical protein
MTKPFSFGAGVPPFAADSDVFDHLVRHTIGRYLGVEADSIQATQQLRDHLDMKTVDIALVLARSSSPPWPT